MAFIVINKVFFKEKSSKQINEFKEKKKGHDTCHDDISVLKKFSNMFRTCS